MKAEISALQTSRSALPAITTINATLASSARLALARVTQTRTTTLPEPATRSHAVSGN
jgi:hypothetical protein